MGIANIFGPSEEYRLRLKAEIMGFPGNLVRAYFGDAKKSQRLLDVPEPKAAEILDEGKAITMRLRVFAHHDHTFIAQEA